MKHSISVLRVVSILGLLLVCSGALGCPSDKKKSAGDAGAQGGSDASTSEHDAATSKNTDAGDSMNAGDASTEGDSGETSSGGEISGPASFHAELSDATSSNVKLDAIDTDTPSGVSAVNDDLRGTSFSASDGNALDGRGVTIMLSGDLKPGAKFELVPDAYSATRGKGHVRISQSSFDGSPHNNVWVSEAGTVTVEAVKGSAVKLSSSLLPMIVATSNAPSNEATGTFKAKIEAQVLEVSGL